MRRHLIAGLLSALALFSGAALLAAKDSAQLAAKDAAKDKTAQEKVVQNQPAKDPFGYMEYRRNALRNNFPDVVLRTQDNTEKRYYQDLIKDKVVVIQFMFARCDDLCPRVTPNLAQVQRELNRRVPGKVTFLSITVDPKRDTPNALREYASHFDIQRGWYFLTGKPDDVDLVRRKLGGYDPEDQKLEHMNMLTIGNEAQGKWLAMEALARPDDITQTVLRVLGERKVEKH
jgi:protein SCO1/2